MSVSFTLNGITSTAVWTGTLGYFGNSSGGWVLINDKANGLGNYLAVGATSTSGMLQQSIGALFSLARLFSAYDHGTLAMAVASLGIIGNGTGLVSGEITLMTGDEHLDARILTIDRRCAGTGRLGIVQYRVGRNGHRPPENCGLNQRLPGQVFPGWSFTGS